MVLVPLLDDSSPMGSSRMSQAQTGQSETVPQEVRELLKDALPEDGVVQWWNGLNRYLDPLDGGRPCDYWAFEPEKVLEAAAAFRDGAYL